MALTNPPADPTWAEIQAAIEENDAERTRIETVEATQSAIIDAAEVELSGLIRDKRALGNHLRRWIAAIRRKAGEDD